MKNIRYKLLNRQLLSELLLVCALFFAASNLGYSQMTVTSGTKVVVSSAGSLNSTQNVVLDNGGTLDVQGTLILKKNLENNNATANSLGTGAIVFSGTTAQTISGQNIIQNLELANSNGLTVAGNTRVNGTLTLTNGLVTLGSYSLLLGPDASVSGTLNASNMVVAPGPGELRKEFKTAAPSFTFPVGDAVSTAEYSPVTLAFNSGATFGANNYAGVTVVNATAGTPVTSYLTRYWTVSQSAITGFACNSTFKYVDADVQGTEADIFCFKVDTPPFTAYNAANTSANTIDAQGLAAFGTFTGNLGDANPPPAVRSLQNKTIASGDVKCADASQTLLIAGNGTTYLVQNGGSVEHHAGVNIVYYTGTKVELGGYMHGSISPSVFCSPYVHPIIEAPAISGIENPGIGNPNNSVFKIYPNPTPGKFTLELNGDVTSAKVHVEIFGVLGDRILSKDMQIDRKQEFSLVERPTGVYVVHVTSGVNSETEKIIKK